jgi:hypothetical protein
MPRRVRRFGGLLAVLALFSAALATTTNAVPRAVGRADVGVTADTINIDYVYGDTSGLQKAGLVSFTGDGGEQFKTFIDLANQNGGAAGRKFKVTTHQYTVPSTATSERPACVAATEDDQAFIVVFQGGQTEETLLCSADEHQRITLAIAANARAIAYPTAKGRLFTNDMSADRLMKVWVTAAKKQGLLKGKTIGIVRPDVSTHAALAKTLTQALKKAGFSVADEVALPCEGQSCQQADVGAQRLQSANVDTLFSLLPAIPYPSFVGAAGQIGYHPQWLSSDFEFQVYNTTLQFFKDVMDSYKGAVGISTTVEIHKPDAPRTKCNADFTKATGTAYDFKKNFDAWSNVGTNCGMVERIVTAANAAQKAGGLTQKSFIREFEKLPVVEGNRKGSFTSKKHDAYNTYELYKVGPACTCWQPIKGSAGVATG